MIKKNRLSLLIAVVFGLFTAAAALAADKGPATIELKGPTGKKAAVMFTHEKHQEASTCGECHHGKAEDGTQAPYVEGQKIETCSACHELGKASDAMHKQCKECHKTQAKGPQKCTECHPAAAK